MPPSSPASNNYTPKSSPFPNKKPILRKQSKSEIIFQRSLFASSQLKQAAGAVQILSLGLASRSIRDKKCIHFNEQIEECTALKIKGDDEEEPNSYAIYDGGDSDSDDGATVMARTNPTRKLPLMPSKGVTPQTSFSGDSKAIAMLPSTTLKYERCTTKWVETAMKHGSGKLSPPPPTRNAQATTPNPTPECL
jgi:hypothetical protein